MTANVNDESEGAEPKRGRPSSFKTEYVEQARKLTQLGATDRDVADFFRVSESTVTRWKHVHPEFREALKVGKDAADDRVEHSLFRRAVGYSYDTEKIAINASGDVTRVPYVEHVPPDTTAMIFWLKNRRPAEWRDRQQLEHSGLANNLHSWLVTAQKAAAEEKQH